MKNGSKTLNIPFVDSVYRDDRIETGRLVELGKKINIDCVNWPEAFPDDRETAVYAAHDGVNIYLYFHCRGNDLKAEVGENLGHVANDSCVEFFVSPDPASKRYWNFEFNAIGTINASTRVERPNPRRLTANELARIKTESSVGKEVFAERSGWHEWSLAVSIPLELIGIRFDGKSLAMNGNFYKCGARTSSPHYLSWSPIESERPDFHRPDFFGRITLESSEK